MPIMHSPNECPLMYSTVPLTHVLYNTTCICYSTIRCTTYNLVTYSSDKYGVSHTHAYTHRHTHTYTHTRARMHAHTHSSLTVVLFRTRYFCTIVPLYYTLKLAAVLCTIQSCVLCHVLLYTGPPYYTVKPIAVLYSTTYFLPVPTCTAASPCRVPQCCAATVAVLVACMCNAVLVACTCNAVLCCCV